MVDLCERVPDIFHPEQKDQHLKLQPDLLVADRQVSDWRRDKSSDDGP